MQLPRDLLAGRRWFSRRHRVAAVPAAGGAYLALAACTVWLLVALARPLATPPRTATELLSAASVATGHPFVYPACEWVHFYAVGPRARPQLGPRRASSPGRPPGARPEDRR